MKVKLEAKIPRDDGEQTVVRSIDMPAPPSIGLRIVGLGWKVEVERIAFVVDGGEYRASCRVVGKEKRPMGELLRIFEMDGWRAT